MAQPDKVIPIRFPADEVERVDRLIEGTESSRSGWMRSAVIKAARQRERELSRRSSRP